jgi:hypothetical protein
LILPAPEHSPLLSHPLSPELAVLADVVFWEAIFHVHGCGMCVPSLWLSLQHWAYSHCVVTWRHISLVPPRLLLYPAMKGE